MKRWNKQDHELVESPQVDAFIEDLQAVYKKHGMALSHEDTQGAFIVVQLDQKHCDWLSEAHINLKK